MKVGSQLSSIATPQMDARNSQPDRLKILLNQEGLRLTSQRRKVLEILVEGAEVPHLNAEMIHQQLSDRGEHISLSTVYRALHALVAIGLVRELTLAEHHKVYELNEPRQQTHHHLVCVRCGAVIEFEASEIVQISSRQAESKGFSPLDCQFMVYGICPDCCGAEESLC